MHLLETSLADRNQAQELQRRRQQAKQQSEMCKARALSAHTQMTTAQESKKAVEEKRLRILSQNERNLKNLLYLRYAEEVAQQLKETYVRKEKETRKELEETINRIFEEIYDGGIELHVSDDYNVRTSVTDTFGSAKGDDLEQNTAQSYAVIFAFISSIIELAKKPDAFAGDDAMKVSKESYPLVMDAPLSSFDKTRIARICQALPEIAEQVIIFIKDTDGETAEKYLDSRIGSKWKLIPQNKTNTTIERRN
jgi:DNA sulfur modification protein DndD